MSKPRNRQSLIASASALIAVMALMAVSALALSACAAVEPKAEALAPVESTTTTQLEITEVSSDGLAVPGEPTVLWFWSPD